MKAVLIYPTVPPHINGIGDHTVRLASALAEQGCETLVLAAQGEPSRSPTVELAFPATRVGVLRLLGRVRRESPDIVLLQFEQFSYGGRGFNPFLPLLVLLLRAGGTRVALLAHETYVGSPPRRNLLMTCFQAPQFYALARLADVVLFSNSVLAGRYAQRRAARRVGTFGVGSSLPPASVSRAEARRHLGIASDELVVTFFGTTTANKSLDHLASFLALAASHGPVRLLYVGPDPAPLTELATGHTPLTSVVGATWQECANALAAGDIAACFYPDGAALRRTSLMAALALGVPVATNLGEASDDVLRQAADEGVLAAGGPDAVIAWNDLVVSQAARTRAGVLGQALYEQEFAWPVIAARLLSALEPGGRPQPEVTP